MSADTFTLPAPPFVPAARGPRRRVLVIAYHYPPRQNGGVERSRQLVHLLPEHGWDPIVLTLRGPCEPAVETGGQAGGGVVRAAQWNLAALRSLVAPRRRRGDRGASSSSARPRPRTWRRDLLEHLLFPDPEVTWALPALRAASRVLERGSVDAIYSTSPPESSHLLASILKRRTGLPWVMDLRDPWSFEPLKKPARTSRLRRALEARLERALFERADHIVLNTAAALDAYRALYADLAHKMAAVPNGVDFEELETARRSLDGVPGVCAAGARLLAHAGTFTRLGWRDPVPQPLLEAMARLRGEGRLDDGRARFVFAGPSAAEIRRALEAHGLADLVDLPGALPHADALRLLLAADLLLVYDPPDDGRTYVRGKVYECLAAGKPLVGVVPEGATRAILVEAGCELLADPRDPAAIVEVLGRALSAPLASLAPCVLPHARLDRRARAAELAAELERAVGMALATAR